MMFNKNPEEEALAGLEKLLREAYNWRNER